MWPFRKNEKPEDLAEYCLAVVKTTQRALSEADPSPKSVANAHPVELLALTVYACHFGIRIKYLGQSNGRSTANDFKRLMIKDLIDSGACDDESTLTEFLDARFQAYDQCTQQKIQEYGRWDRDIAKDVAVVFEQACRGPDANHTPNAEDAREVLHLRMSGASVVLNSIEAVLAKK